MNVRRFLTAAAASSALLAAAAPCAQALDFGGTLSGTAQTAATTGQQAKEAAQSVVGDKLDRKVGAVKDTVKAGKDAMKAGHELVS
ncbi:hypothetical protein ACIGXA_06765 [Streptomyces fildesensis]|uniref:Lipoprotein n=1 Tax=Streptomyces fildesensis TaxID=375757 RepID=A0ABW8C1A7_9ACTN